MDIDIMEEKIMLFRNCVKNTISILRCGLDTSLRFTFCANVRFTLSFFFFFWGTRLAQQN